MNLPPARPQRAGKRWKTAPPTTQQIQGEKNKACEARTQSAVTSTLPSPGNQDFCSDRDDSARLHETQHCLLKPLILQEGQSFPPCFSEQPSLRKCKMVTIFKHKTKRHLLVIQQVRRFFLSASFLCQDLHSVHQNQSSASKVYTHPTSALGRQHVGIKDTNIDLEPMQMQREHVTTTNTDSDFN